jgi:[acyl-carrier-protein] S-malonyltransferase
MPSGAAGFSLGEYAALALAKVISVEDCFRLVAMRGKAMHETIERISKEENAPGMAAVIGLPPEQVAELISQWKAEGLSELYAANYNSSRQVVVSGTDAALKIAQTRFKEAGAKRVLRLPVAGPFHSPLMSDAAEKFSPLLESTQFNDPAIPLYSNVSGGIVTSGIDAKKLALRHIVEPVRWMQEESAIMDSGVQMLLEVGPGKVLQGLWRETGNPIPCYTAGTVLEIEEIISGFSKN